MKARATDDQGDWQFGRGKQSYQNEVDALKQNIFTRLRQWKGDCYYKTGEGVDWVNLLDTGTKNLLDLDVKRVILQTAGVLRITTYSSILTNETRALRIECTLSTTFGTVTINQAV